MTMDQLADLVPSLRNVVARAGTFDSFFPETTEDDLLQVLLDGLADAQLHGLLLTFDADEAGTVIPEFSRAQGALMVLFAGYQLVRAELFNRITSRKYVASNASMEEVQATNILRDIMRQLDTAKTRIMDKAEEEGYDSAFYMADQYVARVRGVEVW